MTKTQNKTQTKKNQADENDAAVVANSVRIVGRLTAEPTVVELPNVRVRSGQDSRDMAEIVITTRNIQ